MKRLLLLLFIIVGSLPAFSQNPDILTMTNGNVFQVRILEETNDRIKFYKLDDPSKEEQDVLKKHFSSIEYFKVPRKANLINITHPTLSENELFLSVGRALRDEGYVFDEVDKDFWVITTKPKSGKYNISYWLNVSVTGNKVIISAYGDNGVSVNYGGGISSSLSSKGGTRGANSGMKNSLINYPFQMMDTFAKAYTDKHEGVVEYHIE